MILQRAQEIDLQIVDYAFGGRGIARIQTDKGPFVIFVDNAFPGQLVRAKIETKRKSFAEAKLLEVLERADIETVSDFQEISSTYNLLILLHLKGKMKLIPLLILYSNSPKAPLRPC